jgi:hypothetical protein
LSGPSSVPAGKSGSFSVMTSNVTSSRYSWTSSDGGTGSGSTYRHTFRRAGKVTVTVTATGAAECVAHVSKTVRVVGKDAITHLAVSPKKLETKATITYRASAAATTTLTIERKARKGYKVVKHLTHRDKAGKVEVVLRRGKLKPGRYRVEARSKDAAGKSKPVYATFTVGS